MYSNLDASKITIREISLETERLQKQVKKHTLEMSDNYIYYFSKLGIKEPRKFTLKLVALIRMPFGDQTLFQYFDQPFSPQSLEVFSDVVVSSLANELLI